MVHRCGPGSIGTGVSSPTRGRMATPRQGLWRAVKCCERRVLPPNQDAAARGRAQTRSDAQTSTATGPADVPPQVALGPKQAALVLAGEQADGTSCSRTGTPMPNSCACGRACCASTRRARPGLCRLAGRSGCLRASSTRCCASDAHPCSWSAPSRAPAPGRWGVAAARTSRPSAGVSAGGWAGAAPPPQAGRPVRSAVMFEEGWCFGRSLSVQAWSRPADG